MSHSPAPSSESKPATAGSTRASPEETSGDLATDYDFLLINDAKNGMPWQPKFDPQASDDLLDQMVQDHLKQTESPPAATPVAPEPLPSPAELAAAAPAEFPASDDQDLQAQISALLGVAPAEPAPAAPPPEPAAADTTTPDAVSNPIPEATTPLPQQPTTGLIEPAESASGAVSAAELDALLCSSPSMEQAVAEALHPEMNFANVEPLASPAAATPMPTAEPANPVASALDISVVAQESSDPPANVPPEPAVDTEGFSAESPMNVATIEDDISALPNPSAGDAEVTEGTPKNTPATATRSTSPTTAVTAEEAVSAAPVVSPVPPSTVNPAEVSAATASKTPPLAEPARRPPGRHLVKDVVMMAAQLMDMPFATVPPGIKQFIGICGALLVLGATVLLVLASRH